MTFWQHLDVLRGHLIRMLIAFVLCSIVAFCFRRQLFEVVTAPTQADFPLFVFLQRFVGDLQVSLTMINTSLAGQFMVHIRMSLVAGLLLSMPYLLFELMRFVSPALYQSERRLSVRLLIVSYLMFCIGVLVAYYIIFPLTVLFLGSYQVSAEINNLITLESYVSMMLPMLMLMGLIFELPVLCYLLARLGLIRPEWLSRYRKYAVVAILCLSAVITPSGDAFTLLVTALPLYALYEISVLVTRHAEKTN